MGGKLQLATAIQATVLGFYWSDKVYYWNRCRMVFIGWVRTPGGKWERWCEAESADLCERKLIDAGPVGPHERKVVPDGNDPNSPAE